MASANFTLYPVNDQFIQLTGLYSWAPDGTGMLTSKTYQNSATVTATLLDVAKNPVPGCINLPLANVPGSNGIYRGQVGSGFNPPLGGGYTTVITAVYGNSTLTFSIPTIIALRTK